MMVKENPLLQAVKTERLPGTSQKCGHESFK